MSSKEDWGITDGIDEYVGKDKTIPKRVVQFIVDNIPLTGLGSGIFIFEGPLKDDARGGRGLTTDVLAIRSETLVRRVPLLATYLTGREKAADEIRAIYTGPETDFAFASDGTVIYFVTKDTVDRFTTQEIGLAIEVTRVYKTSTRIPGHLRGEDREDYLRKHLPDWSGVPFSHESVRAMGRPEGDANYKIDLGLVNPTSGDD